MNMAALRARAAELTRRGRAAFDARTLRERVLIGAALAAALLMLADAMVIAPAAQTWRQARQQHQRVLADLTQARAEARVAAQGLDPVRQLEQQIEQARQRVTALDRELGEQAAGLVGADRMVQVLEQMLVRQPQVRVRRMQSLPRTDLLAEALPAAAGAAVPPAADKASAPRRATAALYRHGVELTVEGGWHDLLGYLHSLEAQPQQLLPGGLQFKVEKHPLSTLTLRLYTLSMDRHWLEI